MSKNFEAVIGLEVHAQLATDSKIFTSSGTESGREPNSLCDPVTLGLPGCLPVVNKRVVEYAVKLGLATDCTIERESIFARKHYFYPDLPKGYQISQYERPICTNGRLEIRVGGQSRSIGITRIHLEEDAGKSIHSDCSPHSFVDLNRAGVPLAEIVSEPEMHTPEEAGAYTRQLRQVLRYLGICDGNMEQGSLRCDANISIREVGEKKLGTKVEIKNLNSFRFIEKALEYEISRQTLLKEQGKEIAQETRLWDEQKNCTRSMRSKEYAEDYRYFPDPDLPPLVIDSGWIMRARDSLPELPAQVFERFKTMYGLDDYLAELLSEEKLTATYYDKAVSFHNNPLAIANWITTELFGRLRREELEMSSCPLSPENLASLVQLIDDGVISGKIAKTIFDEMFQKGCTPESIVASKGLRQISDVGEIEPVIDRILAENPSQVEQYREGKTKMLGYFVGLIMKETSGKANPGTVNKLLKDKLGQS